MLLKTDSVKLSKCITNPILQTIQTLLFFLKLVYGYFYKMQSYHVLKAEDLKCSVFDTIVKTFVFLWKNFVSEVIVDIALENIWVDFFEHPYCSKNTEMSGCGTD